MNGGYREERDGADEGGYREERGGADGGGAAGGIRHTNALYKRNEQLLAAAISLQLHPRK